MLTINTNRSVGRLMDNNMFEDDNQNPQIQAIKKAMKDTKNIRLYQRYRVIDLYLKGNTNRDIAKMEGFCEHTVGTYISKYKANGIDALGIKHGTGAPRFLTAEQEEKLVEVITTKTPDQVGFPSRKNWYINIVQQWVKNTFGVEYSHRGMAEVLYRSDLSFTRPTYTLAKADPKKQENFMSEFKLLKKAD
jgi:transposase